MASQDLMPDPNGTNKPLPKNVAQLRAKAEKLAADAEKSRQDAEAQIAEANALQQKLGYLNKDVDDAADALMVGEAQAASFEAAMVAIESAMANSWGRRNGYQEQLPPPDYSQLVAFKAAAADWPRVREILAERAAKAQSALSAFEKSNF